MESTTDRGKDTVRVVGGPQDAGSFREAVEGLLRRAVENGVDIEYTSWKCVSNSTTTWEVEITPVEQS